MKRIALLLLSLCLVASLARSASALVYSDTSMFDHPLRVSPLSSIDLAFDPVPSSEPFTSAYLTLYGTVNPLLLPRIYVGIGTEGNDLLYLGTIRFYDHQSNGISLNLSLLNSYIQGQYGEPLVLRLFSFNGRGTLTGATLNGTLAPEPISMALVGAGLAGLPFARRFRKSLS